MTLPYITYSTAAGFGCCDSTTASPAQGLPPPPHSPTSCACKRARQPGSGSSGDYPPWANSSPTPRPAFPSFTRPGFLSAPARRRARAGPSFLLADHPQFAARARACFELGLRTTAEKRDLRTLIYETIQPVDLAGLADQTRRNWLPVEPRDLIKAAPKLRASETDIR